MAPNEIKAAIKSRRAIPIFGSIAMDLVFTTTGWMDRQIRADRNTIGTSTNPTIAITAQKTALFLSLSTERRRIRYAEYISQRMKVAVSLGSQVHQVFHMGLAHMEPVIRTRVVRRSPISTEEAAKTSHFLFCRLR